MAETARYLLGLDAGNTVIKAVLFDADGRQLAARALDGRSVSPAPGRVERDMDELWANAGEVIRACIAEAGIAPEDIAAVGCAGHGNGLYIVDGDGASVIGIQSLDTRASDMAAELSAKAGEALFDLCLQKPWPSQTPMLLAWIKRHAPELYARAATVLLCKDVINFRLTGERTSDVSDMSGCGLVQMPDGVYDDRLMSLYGLDDAVGMLPRLIDPTGIAGHVTEDAARTTGLAPGTPVIGGFFDVIASALGSGVVHAGQASLIVGTWSINQVVSETPITSDDVFMVAGFGPGRFMNIESSATSAANLEWYVREFVERGGHHDDPFGQCSARIAEVTPDAGDPIYLPFLYGSRLGSDFRAGLYGLGGWHGEGHVLRAIYEGVMFEHRRHVGVLRAAGLVVSSATLSGGGTRSPVWPQMFADGLGLPVTVAESQETGALGAAIGAAVAAGLHPDLESAVAAMTRTKSRLAPDPDMQAHYDARYHRFTAIRDAMRPLWAEDARKAQA
ncbi:FGGY-family carbohydrate kinase [Chachezhania antarctica]|uniref:FGGY-family carbohydrate kinase n=1 Tax=Chachezhania antarctica TaxID=2340860 RepID=UPI000EB1F133|nr:FGGY-family carbohydrate kinase [Chachezhania antarctica]|tara:strand:+ start:5078 stop:6592 length:1515 start_codon:yes stop_codon:yes gene_type:complete